MVKQGSGGSWDVYVVQLVLELRVLGVPLTAIPGTIVLKKHAKFLLVPLHVNFTMFLHCVQDSSDNEACEESLLETMIHGHND